MDWAAQPMQCLAQGTRTGGKD